MARWWYGLRQDNSARADFELIHYYRKFQLEIWYAIGFQSSRRRRLSEILNFAMLGCKAR